MGPAPGQARGDEGLARGDEGLARGDEGLARGDVPFIIYRHAGLDPASIGPISIWTPPRVKPGVTKV